MVLDMCNQCTEIEADKIVDVKRLGKKTVGSARPVVVKFSDEQTKASLMTNLSELRNADEPFDEMRVQHDMTPSERETEKKLIAEAKEKSEADSENFFYVVRGLPGNRKVVQVKKRR